MRLIGTLHEEKQVRTFAHFLDQKKITHQIEAVKDTDWGSSNYGTHLYRIWITDEDQWDEALKGYELFLENPQDSSFITPLYDFDISSQSEDKVAIETEEPLLKTSPASATWNQKPLGFVTRLLILSCCALTFLSWFLLSSTQEKETNVSIIPLFSSPVEKNLLYDYPYTYQLISQFIQKYGYEAFEHPEVLPKEGHQLAQQIEQTPFWQGFYTLVQKGGLQALNTAIFQIPMFERIREGEVWRLFSPCLFHVEFFHLFFNMIWLLVLGKQIEQRLGTWRYILFILILGIFSNTAQYLMAGPNFIGFSGILCGMLTFMWMRQKHAPWEGYQLDRVTVLFLALFILIMATVQFVSFFLEKTLGFSISPGIANTAHLSGAAIGFLLGRLNLFSWSRIQA